MRFAKSRVALVALISLGIAGCATHANRFNPKQTDVDPDAYVVAMSINTMNQAGKPVDSTSPHFGIEQIAIRGANPILMYDLEPGLGLVVLELDEPSLELINAVVSWTEDGDSRLHYMTETAGPTVKLKQGAVNYVGSLVIRDYDIAGQSSHDDSSNRADEFQIDAVGAQSGSIVLEFVDEWDLHASIWKENYAVFGERAPVKVIAGPWDSAGPVGLGRAVVGYSGGYGGKTSVRTPKNYSFDRSFDPGTSHHDHGSRN